VSSDLTADKKQQPSQASDLQVRSGNETAHVLIVAGVGRRDDFGRKPHSRRCYLGRQVKTQFLASPIVRPMWFLASMFACCASRGVVYFDRQNNNGQSGDVRPTWSGTATGPRSSQPRSSQTR